jgi:plastocyanin
MKTLLTLVVLALLAWGGYALFADNDSEVATPGGQTYLTPATYQTPNTSTSTATSSPGVIPAVKTFNVTGQNFSFAPSTMTVNKGDRVKINFTNQAGTHDLVVEGYNVRTKVLQGGQSETIEFTANQSGTFEYYCSVGTHRQMGMKGTLKVN